MNKELGLRKRRKKLLVLTPRFPYPVVGGDRLRIFYLCKVLSKRFDLVLLSFCETKVEMDYKLPGDGVFFRVERVLLPRWKSLLNCMIAVFSRAPLQVAYYRDKQLFDMFTKLEGQCDGVLVHLIRMAEYAKLSTRPTFLEMTDAISLNYERVARSSESKGFMKRVYIYEQKKLQRYEKLMPAYFDVVSFVSDVDKQYLFCRSQFLNKVHVCSNGVDVSKFEYVEDRCGNEIVFIGNMLSVQNMDAVMFFAERVMPSLLKMGLIFKVVGRINDTNMRLLKNMAGVVVTGEVDSISDAVQGGVIAVCPMRIGAGVQNKVLEYMALGLPVICSKLGREGLAAVEGQDLLVEDREDGYISTVKKLFLDSSMRKKLARNGRSYVERVHSWDGVLDNFLSLVDQHVVG